MHMWLYSILLGWNLSFNNLKLCGSVKPVIWKKKLRIACITFLERFCPWIYHIQIFPSLQTNLSWIKFLFSAKLIYYSLIDLKRNKIFALTCQNLCQFCCRGCCATCGGHKTIHRNEWRATAVLSGNLVKVLTRYTTALQLRVNLEIWRILRSLYRSAIGKWIVWSPCSYS